MTNFRWEPPREADDDQPILDAGSPPGYFVGPAPTASESETVAADPFVQVFVNVGSREGVHPADVQQLLTAGGVPGVELGAIRVRDRMTFVRIRRDSFERAVAALSGQVIGGRTVVAELARGRG